MADPEYRGRLVFAYTELMRREERIDLGFSEMARRFNELTGESVTTQVMGRWLKGHEQPREPMRRKALAAILGASVGWLFYDEGQWDAGANVSPDVERNATEHAREIEEAERKAAAKRATGGRKRA